MTDGQRTCTQCGETKELTEFALQATGSGGRRADCKACQAARQREVRANQSAESKAAEMAAYRAGMRKDRCAICAATISGQGICADCADLVEALGGLEGLKRATKAVRWLDAQGL